MARPKKIGTATVQFDRTKPYGTIHGHMEDTPTAAYEQDGVLFDRQGNHVGGDAATPSFAPTESVPTQVSDDPQDIDEASLAAMRNAA